jgi:hypothetical protein
MKGAAVKIPEVTDSFNVRPQPKHFAAADPNDRRLLLRYIRKYLEACERQDRLLPSVRQHVNGD